MRGIGEPPPLDVIALIIQIALTPVFLLSGIAALLGAFSTRLARIADRLDVLSQTLEKIGSTAGPQPLARRNVLRRRSWLLDAVAGPPSGTRRRRRPGPSRANRCRMGQATSVAALRAAETTALLRRKLTSA
jgi:hypothetical protein